MTDEELRERTGLNDEDIQKLKELKGILPLIADLMGSDMFIDCRQQEDGQLFVAAQTVPSDLGSAYMKNVEGMVAERKNEPAAYQAYNCQIPMRDIKATTQENKRVKQNVVPILNDSEHVIGVLISEQDVSVELQNEQKYNALKKKYNHQQTLISGDRTVRETQELYHRVKNHLQVIMSIMNLQARRSENEEVTRILNENVTRIMNMSALYELLMVSEEDRISLKEYLEKMILNVQVLMATEKRIHIFLEGDDIWVSQNQATDIALVVNEFLTNAYKHAFHNQEEGNISVTLKDGQEYWTVIVQDDGQQNLLHKEDNKKSLGLDLVKTIVSEKLNGKVYVNITERGTTAAFDIRI